MLQQKKLMENVLMPFLDVLCVLLSAMIAFQVRYGKWLGIAQDWDQGWLLWMIVCLAVVLEIIFDYYHHFFRRGYFDELIAVGKEQLFLTGSWIILLYILHRSSQLSRLALGYFTGINVIVTYFMHILVKQYLLKVYLGSYLLIWD